MNKFLFVMSVLGIVWMFMALSDQSRQPMFRAACAFAGMMLSGYQDIFLVSPYYLEGNQILAFYDACRILGGIGFALVYITFLCIFTRAVMYMGHETVPEF